jgi:hypothetical protein
MNCRSADFFQAIGPRRRAENINGRRVPILWLKNGIVRSRQVKSTKIPKRFGTQWASKSGTVILVGNVTNGAIELIWKISLTKDISGW